MKVCTLCFSLFASFALFAVHVSNRSDPWNFQREAHENHESVCGLFLIVRAVRGSWNLKGSVPCRRQAPFMEGEAGVGEVVRTSPAPGEAFCLLPLSAQEKRVFQRGRC